jgi:exopolyphosphatase/guanosine-5'-triphosphate,3'-diphosphate pyrophosphatase
MLLRYWWHARAKHIPREDLRLRQVGKVGGRHQWQEGGQEGGQAEQRDSRGATTLISEIGGYHGTQRATTVTGLVVGIESNQQRFLSADLSGRLAAIDIGSNSVRLIVAEAVRGGNYRILDEEREPTRLGRSVGQDGNLDAESMEKTITALDTFKKISAGFQAESLRVIATCAIREAGNGPDFCRRIRDEIGLDVEVISGEQEGRYAFSSVQHAFDLTDKNVVVADIGGGSTEIVFSTGEMIEEIYSTPLGAVRLTEQFPCSEVDAADAFLQMEREITNCLKRKTGKPPFAPHFMVGCGGTFTTLADLLMAARKGSDRQVAGFRASHADVRHLLDRLRKLPVRSRRALPGMTPDRADIIVAGVAIIDALMKRFRINSLVVHSRGVRDGLLREMIQESHDLRATTAELRMSAVDRFADACSGEAEHGRQVAFLAGRIYEQLREPFGMPEGDRLLVETAARLQDVGYVISYEQHHKHSYHLIRNSQLPGLRQHDLELIANVARYHRGASPKRKHDAFRRLTSDERQRVRRLAAILRLAGGLDRSRSQQVRDVRACVDDGRVTLQTCAEEEPQVDIWGAERRRQLFEEVFGMPVTITWQAAVSSQSS